MVSLGELLTGAAARIEIAEPPGQIFWTCWPRRPAAR